ncbi:hypothetical protein KXS07_32950 [Inquilinus limosus]|uniref:hypothetical protein n=1 Tax=Inquilinus limosus TaxID=171674 RepID=UPI003F15495C
MSMMHADRDAGEIRDPDSNWTEWVRATLRELIEIDMRTKRMIAMQQKTTSVPSPPDFS